MDAASRALQQQGLLAVAKDPGSAIRQAAADTGVDFDYLWRTAQRESGMNASARASTSSAAGLFQFTDETWLRMVDRYGARYGMAAEADQIETRNGKPVVADPAQRASILALRDDPVASARMAGELANENGRILEARIGRPATSRELYAAHFLGPSGAAKLIEAAGATPDASASDLFPREAAANPGIFLDSEGEARSVSAVYARLTGQDLGDASPASVAVKVYQASAPYIAKAAEGSGDARISTGLLMALINLRTSALGDGEET